MNRPEVILREAASELRRQKPSMSLRAVASRLKISPSYWSKILHGQKPLPQKLIPTVVKVLEIDRQGVARLQRSILKTIENDRLAPATGLHIETDGADSPVEDYQNLGRDEFWLLKEWYFLPILNLLSLSNPPDTTEAISSALGLHIDVVNESLSRLVAAGALAKDADGKLSRTNLKLRFPTNRSHAEVRNYHRTMIKRAESVLARTSSEVDFEARLISGLNFAGSSAKINEARLIIEEALYRAANLMAGESETDEIYQLNVQLFPMTCKTRPFPK